MEIQGKDIILSVSTVLTPGSEVWKELICLETLTVVWSTDVNKRKTRCGTKIGVGNVEVTMNGTTVADDAPSVTQISHKEIEGFMAAGTPVRVKAAHATTPAKYFVAGDAYFTSNTENMPSDDLFAFDFQLDITGTLDLVP